MKASELKAWLVTVTDKKGAIVKTVPAPSKYAAKQVRNRLTDTYDSDHTIEAKAA